MARILMILEVSRKQEYIFATRKLKENAARSAEISYVTGSEFFKNVAPELYDEDRNLIYSGGGHTVLQFEDAKQANRFARRVSRTAMTGYSGLELFVKQIDYDESRTPGENLKELAACLERKKSLRAASFRQTGFGVEALDTATFQLKELDKPVVSSGAREVIEPPAGYHFPNQMEDLAGEDNFVAVVHIDGNAMGKRVNQIYEMQTGWESCCASLKRFSLGIQKDFEEAFAYVVENLSAQVTKTDVSQEGKTVALPIRPIILAGDDVCFVTTGKLGLECARLFMEKLVSMENEEQPGIPYASCAGVALVHTKYPFHRAYNLAEELCSSAKRFGASIDSEGRISVMDWHIELGQLKDGLSTLRRDYACEDGGRMELRPVTVHIPAEVDAGTAERATGGVRTYGFVRNMCLGLQSESGKTARGKIKQLRTAFKQGKVETEFVMHDSQVSNLLWHSFASCYPEWEQKRERFQERIDGNVPLMHQAFLTVDGVSRCLFFDAVEMIDHYEPLQEVDV